MSRLENIPLACIEVIINYCPHNSHEPMPLSELRSQKTPELIKTLQDRIDKASEERRATLNYILYIFRQTSGDLEKINYFPDKKVEEQISETLSELFLNLKLLLGTSTLKSIHYDNRIVAMKGLQLSSWDPRSALGLKSEAISNLGTVITKFFIKSLRINLDTKEDIDQTLKDMLREHREEALNSYPVKQTQRLLNQIDSQQNHINQLANKRSYISLPVPGNFYYKSQNKVATATQTEGNEQYTCENP